MKRVLVTLLALLIGFPLVLGGILALTYTLTGESSVPNPVVVLGEQKLLSTEYEWHAPVFAGMMYKDFYQKGGEGPQNIGKLTEQLLPSQMPTGYETVVTVKINGEQKWQGSGDDFARYPFIDSGNYEIEVVCIRPEAMGRGYGRFFYRAGLVVLVEPRIEASAETVQQGDVLALRIFNLTGNTEIRCETNLGMVTFTDSGKGTMTAFVPISYTLEPTRYTVTVYCGGSVWRLPVHVAESYFPESRRTINYWEMGDTASQWAYTERAMKLEPFYKEADPEQHWKGPFLAPVEGEIITSYGEYVFENNNTRATRSNGIQISATGGTPVLAPGNGRVVFAEQLLNTGNTVVIEHGGGLKSYLFHLDDLKVGAGEMVSRGDSIGTVGKTGAVLEPTLGYELRIGSRAINPELLLGGSGGFFHFT